MTQSSEQTTVWLTPAALTRLTAELADLEGPQWSEIVERISSARDEGDLKENGGYHAAKDEQGKMKGRIDQLKALLRDVTTETSADDGVVSSGKVVTYRFEGDDEVETFLLANREVEGDEGLTLEVYSAAAPLGSALLGAQKGTTASFEAPNGKTLQVEVVDAVPYTA